jgi:cellulose synthase/poly-beta-1,6-N-acetylglucosamine synthase-like glycosyltransferase/tetratricopeptide (TPR) repeat protein
MEMPRFRQALIVLTLITAVLYLAYRACFTMNLTTPYAVGVSVTLYVAELFMGILLLLFLLQVWHPFEPPEQPVLPDRTVDVLVPTYNEDVEILRLTLIACVQMDYPHKTYLCDDGGTDARINDPEKGPGARKRQAQLKALCEEVGAIYLTRAKNEHAKAGNMNSALKHIDGEFVIILDADHVPERNFITRLIGYFADEKLAFVQTPHAFYNFNCFQAKYDPVRSTYWEEGQLFYDVIQPGRNYWNAAIFAGSAAMFRRQAIDEIGGFAVETITEDLHTGLRLHARGWKSLAISERLVAGQAAPDVTTFHTQRLRWGEGNLSIFAYDNPLTTPGLTLAQRLCYLGSMIHWANGPFLILIYLTPLFMLFSDVPPVARFEWIFVSLIVLYMTLSTGAFYAVGKGYASFWNSQIYCMTNMWTSTKGMMKAIFGRQFQVFVVTSKRGRQSKSLFVFIWPHATFLMASILALIWGWYRPLSGVSDDFYKPILASFWTVFHICVALAILHRAIWPEDQRFNYRHLVSLPATVTNAGSQADRYAVTVDLNDGGVGLLTYDPLPVGSQCTVTIRGAGSMVQCLAEVRHSREIDARLRAGTRGVRAYQCGLAFVEPAPTQKDSLNQLCWHYAVPLSYAAFARNGLRGQPPPLRLPLILFAAGATEPGWWAVTDDLSQEGLTALLDTDVSVGTEVRFRMPTPGEEVRGTARVVEVKPVTLAARTYYQCRFAFVQVDAGRAMMDVMLGRRNTQRLAPLLRPHKTPRPVPVLRAARVGLLWLAVLVPLIFGLFFWLHQDELFLYRVARAPLPLTSEQTSRLNALVRQAVTEGQYPTTDRLVLLESALLHADKRSEVVQVTRVLAKRDLDNLSLQLAYAQALDDMGEPAAGLEEYRRLLKRIEHGDFSAERRIAVLLAAARTAVHANQREESILWYREVLAATARDPVGVRNELAGVLLGANHAEDAIALFAEPPQDWDGQLLLAKARLLAKDYAAAEKDARELLARRPKDLDAALVLLDALGLRGNVTASRELGSALIEAHPSVVRVRVRVGQLALAVEHYPTALLLFLGLLEDGTVLGSHELDVQRGFIDAASAMPAVEQIDSAALAQVVRLSANNSLAQDAVYLGRLAWLCQRLKRYDLAGALLRRAVDLDPKSAEQRQRYVGVLLAAGRGADALSYLKGLEPSPEVNSLLLDVYMYEKDYAAVERICQATVRTNPLSSRAWMRLAEVALLKKDRARAEECLAFVQRATLDSPESRARLANLHLWMGDGAAALDQYRVLLEKTPNQKESWLGYIDAAASAPKLTDVDARVIRPIAEQLSKDGEDVISLSRLAWVLHRVNEPALCLRVLDRAQSLKPTDPAARKELAGVLGAAGRYKEALALSAGLPVESLGRQHLASLCEAAGDFAGAATHYRVILEKAPKDLVALERLGLVLTWKKDFSAAAKVYERLAAAVPENQEWALRVAELKLWSGDAAGALPAYCRLLGEDPRQQHLWGGFVDAAGQVARLTAVQAQLARRVGREALAAGEEEPLFLSRLAWVLVKAGATADAEAALVRADALQADDLDVRKELAGVFGAVGNFRRAIELYQGLDLTFAERVRLVRFYNGENNFEPAEAECRKLLQERPGDREVKLLLADILGWRGKYTEAVALLRKLRQDDPDSKELALRLARVGLWSGNYTAALDQFATLLQGNANQQELWADLVAAAAAAPALDSRYRKMFLELADKTLADSPRDTLFLSRLAQALRNLKEPGKAADVLQLAVAIDETSRPLKLQFAQTLYDAGRFEQAKRYFRSVLPEPGR